MVTCLLVACACPADAAHAQPATGTKAPTDKPIDYAPGVRIDWGTRVVEVDAEVTLRRGVLELLACSPRTREHESILVVPARPLHIYQAMGLIGLEPGAPVRFDEKAERPVPAHGTRLRLTVRYEADGKKHEVPVEQWLFDEKAQAPPAMVDWVFAGSRHAQDGRFGADMDGTIICVVDFDTAVIAVGALHSADNDQLWLSANTDAIPPRGTRCTLVIGARRPAALEVIVLPDGAMQVGSERLSASDVARRLKRRGGPRNSGRILIRPAPGTGRESIEKAMAALEKAGVDRASMDVQSPAPPRSAPAAPKIPKPLPADG